MWLVLDLSRKFATSMVNVMNTRTIGDISTFYKWLNSYYKSLFN